eukprot:CFRG5622T1
MIGDSAGGGISTYDADIGFDYDVSSMAAATPGMIGDSAGGGIYTYDADSMNLALHMKVSVVLRAEPYRTILTTKSSSIHSFVSSNIETIIDAFVTGSIERYSDAFGKHTIGTNSVVKNKTVGGLMTRLSVCGYANVHICCTATFLEAYLHVLQRLHTERGEEESFTVNIMAEFNIGEDDWLNSDDDEGGDISGSHDGGYKILKYHTVFVVDVSSNMFKQCIPVDGLQSSEIKSEMLSCFEMAMKGLRDTFTQRIIHSPSDLCALVFYNTDKAHNGVGFSNIFVVKQLAKLGPEDLKMVEKLQTLAQGDAGKSFEAEYGICDNKASIGNVLWVALDMINGMPSAKTGHKNIIMFTCNDDPHHGDRNSVRQAKEKANDVAKADVEFRLVCLNDPLRLEHTFDYSLFYKAVCFPSSQLSELATPISSLRDMVMETRRQTSANRVLMRLQWTIGNKVSIGVCCYKLISEKKKPTSVLFNTDQRRVITTTKNVDDATGTVLLPSDLKYSVDVGGKKTYIGSDLNKAMKTLCPQGLLLLGFKPLDRIKVHHNYHTVDFVYPDDSSVENSSALFASLCLRCEAKNVAAICRLTPRSGQPRLVALLPQREIRDTDSNEQLVPPGFNMIYLPYRDDIRNNKYPKMEERPTREQIELAKNIVMRLDSDFSPRYLPDNPTLQHFMMGLEALALDRDNVEKIVDETLPNNDNIEDSAGELLAQLKENIYPEGHDPKEVFVPVKKRTIKDVVDLDEDIGQTVKRFHSQKILSKLTIPKLKAFLLTIGQSSTGKKADLVDKVNSYYDNL